MQLYIKPYVGGPDGYLPPEAATCLHTAFIATPAARRSPAPPGRTAVPGATLKN